MRLVKWGSWYEKNSSTLIGCLLTTPAVLLIIYASVIPFFWNIILSFQSWDAFKPAKFVGFDNFIEAFQTSLTWKALFNTTFLALGSTIGVLLLGITLAALVTLLTGKEGSIFRLFLYSPSLLPMAVVALLFIFIYNPEMGLLNSFLRLVGLGNLAHVWLEDKNFAMFFIVIVCVWKGAGGVMILCFAAMQTIPESIYESCKLEGAKYSTQLFRITLPLIKPTILLCAISTLGGAFKSYDIVYVMTAGGPGDLTMTIPIIMTKQAFQYGYFGYSAALGSILTVVVIAAILLVNRILRSEAYEY